MEITEIDALPREGSFEETALFQETIMEDNALPETQPPFSLVFPSSDISLDEKKLAEIVEENNTGIENKVKGLSQKEDEEQEEYIKSASYESENCYDKTNPYAPKEDYKQIEQMKPKEEEEGKSFLWK